MIRVNNLHKYFNKKRSNEIHVINNTSLEFKSTGLVCLLGNSGSGKTTLLNVIGGLDKVDSGLISIDQENINKYRASKWDGLRNRYFGYIFQNYILLPDLSVYDNLKFVLNMLDVSIEEADQRIEYALKAVGMEKFKKRKPTQLSGGQQQRVAIARALVKSPKVIIADEPTGNLDEKNTTQIMNIIKKISKECLVILVTHERRLADFYGDRIIEIADGKVVGDKEISSVGSFLETDNNNIYLQEFNSEEFVSDNVNIKYFYQDIKKDIHLNIIFRDNTFYIQSDLDKVKIKFIDKANEIKVFDSKKPVISSQNIDEFDYHLKPIKTKDDKARSVIKFTDTIKMALSHLNGLKRRQKLLFVTMFLSTIMITIGLINLFNSKNIDENDFLFYNKNTVQVMSPSLEFMDFVDEESFLVAPVESSVVTEFINLPFSQFSYVSTTREYRYTTNTVASIKVLDEPNLILGDLITKPNDALIDKVLVDKYLEYGNFSSVGIKHRDQFIGLSFKVANRYSDNGEYSTFTIVGIVDNKNHNIYVEDLMYKLAFSGSYITRDYYGVNLEIINNLPQTTQVYLLDDEGYPLEVGTDISNVTLGKNEVILTNGFFYQLMGYSNSNEVNILKSVFKIVGIIDNEENSVDAFIFSSSGVEHLYIDCIENFRNDSYPASYYVHASDKQALINKLDENNITAIDLYEETKDAYIRQNHDPSLYLSSIFVLTASLVFLFLLMRSSMMARIYQIGVYRALGVKKNNVHKIFLTEIFFITLITTLLGIGVVYFTITQINSVVEVIRFPWYISPLAFVSILVVNLTVGSLPILGLLRLTPSQILSKYDI